MVGAPRVTGQGPERGGRRTLGLVGALAVLLGAAPAVSQAEPASKYDAAGQQHNDVCVKLARGLSQTDLRYLSGSATGFLLPKSTLTFTDGSCGTGQLRLDLHEIVDSNAGQLVFHRGGSGYVDSQNVRYGQALTSDLSQGTTWLNRHVQPSGDNRGAECPLLDKGPTTPYHVSVQPIPQVMKYKSPKAAGGSNAGASYLHYGDPAAQQGDQNLNEPPTSSPYPQKYSTSTTTIHYSTLTWSWIDVGGGGMNRILLAPGQDIRRCDVDPIRYDSWAPGSDPNSDGQVNGYVIAQYVQTPVGNGKFLYGWMVWQHYWDGTPASPDNFPSQVVVNHYTFTP
jgi:hypothetical protein